MTLLAEATSLDAQQIFWMAAATFGAGLLTLLTKIASAWGDAQIDKIKSESLRGQVTLAKNEIGDVVYMISQVLVPEVKAAAQDGKVSAEEREKLQAKAISLTRERFSPEFWAGLVKQLGIPTDGLDEWILGQVESRVFRMRMDIGAHPGDEG